MLLSYTVSMVWYQHSSADHWLSNPFIEDLMHRYYFHVSCDSSFKLEGIQSTTLMTITPAEARELKLKVDPHTVPCRYKRSRGGDGLKAIPVSLLSVRKPKMKGRAMVVKNPGAREVKDPACKRRKVVLKGEDVVGKVFRFQRKDPADRSDAACGEVASLLVTNAFGDVREGTFIRVPLDHVCGVDLAKQ